MKFIICTERRDEWECTKIMSIYDVEFHTNLTEKTELKLHMTNLFFQPFLSLSNKIIAIMKEIFFTKYFYS